jgi:hypothetical protein
MNVSCKDLDHILERGTPAERTALEAHAAACPACARQLALEREISAAARTLHREWASPDLWPSIHQRLAAEPAPSSRRGVMHLFEGFGLNWQMAAAAAAVLLLVVASTWMVFNLAPERPGPDVTSIPSPGPTSPAQTPDNGITQPGPAPDPEPAVADSQRRLLTDEALREVERSEAAYMRSIERLSALAAPKLASADSPLLANYREKLLVLDSAIADCRAQLEQNRFNAHLRRELLAVYQMKQATLTEVLQEETR